MQSGLRWGKLSSITSLEIVFFPPAILASSVWVSVSCPFFPHIIFTFVSYFTFTGKVLKLILHITEFISCAPNSVLSVFSVINLNVNIYINLTLVLLVLIIPSHQIHLLLDVILQSVILSLYYFYFLFHRGYVFLILTGNSKQWLELIFPGSFNCSFSVISSLCSFKSSAWHFFSLFFPWALYFYSYP